MVKVVVRSLFTFLLLALAFSLFSAPSPTAQAQRPLPPNNPASGLVYDGLHPDTTGQCDGGLAFTVTAKGRTRTYCTHGPDAAPINVNVVNRAPATVSRRSQRAGSTASTPSLVCDGDGATGSRVQVVYAHASDVPDQYSAYLGSFQQWVSDVDNIFNNSAALTGGTRHVRFVTDSNCVPVIPDVTLSPTGDDNVANTVMELQALGYNLTNRKYLVFVDARVYCGIASTAYDDQPGPSNANNFGNTFGRVDAGCWGPWLAAHEIEHQLGGVQMSAPHSDGNWHCTDGYDIMCDYGAVPNITYTSCPDSSYNGVLDCNGDDYYSTNPPAGSYLSQYWNSANSVFLIRPQTAHVDSIVSGKVKGKTFTATNSFSPGNTVTMRIHVVNQNNASVVGLSVTMPVNRPNGTTQCTFTAKTDSTGTAQGSCQIPKNGPRGTWQGNVTSLTAAGYSTDAADSVLTDTFQVQ